MAILAMPECERKRSFPCTGKMPVALALCHGRPGHRGESQSSSRRYNDTVSPLTPRAAAHRRDQPCSIIPQCVLSDLASKMPIIPEISLTVLRPIATLRGVF
jgi:hypothetical protein